MTSAATSARAVDPGGRGLYRVGGLCALALGAAYVVTLALYAVVGAPPSGGEAWLEYAAGKTAAWWAILGLSVLTDFLFLPVALALYLALRGVDRNAMLLATAFIGLFVVLDLAITWPNYAALIALGSTYAAASYASAVLTSTLAGVYNIVTLSVGILIVGVVMLKGPFGKGAAYVGVATGVLGVVSVAGPLLVSALGVAIIVASALTTLWLCLVGYRLYRLGQP